MENLLKQAKDLQEDLVKIRRDLHECAETGFALTQTLALVRGELKKLGYTPQKCGRAGLIATVGKGAKCFLLRADMDALKISEKSGERFACKNGNMHACGHDLHTAMLLGATRLLKANEDKLNGQVKLLFQPAEEILEGAKNVLNAGVLKNPKVHAAMALHVATGVELVTGTAVVASGVSAPAADYFAIEVQGKGCHGSTPWNGIDALTVAARILLALQEIHARELPLAHSAVLTVGAIEGGKTGNAICDCALLHGTLRAFDEGVREKIKMRVKEIAKKIAKAFGAKAKVVYGGGCPTLLNDKDLSVFALNKARELLGKKSAFSVAELSGGERAKNGGSEDFAYITHEVPSVMVSLAAGEKGKGYEYPLHHPKVTFDESALCVGAALYAHIAIEWLQGV
ncbi:MAG: amidohydrolase [Clostridia bacterium]|nr:amidohydrolase [Clostridia bacterium]